MNNVVDVNEFKVVEFTNSTNFDFTPEMGCMYDGRPIFGISGSPCIKAGESKTLPYKVGIVLATNLAKAVLVRGSSGKPQLDEQGNPMIKAIWDDTGLEQLKKSFMTELYTDQKPKVMSETDRLMEKVAELAKWKQEMESKSQSVSKIEVPKIEGSTVYQDKAEVIAELTKRGIKFDARQNKDNLAKLLV